MSRGMDASGMSREQRRGQLLCVYYIYCIYTYIYIYIVLYEGHPESFGIGFLLQNRNNVQSNKFTVSIRHTFLLL